MWNIFNRWRQGELRHFAPLFNMGAAPSSGHLLHCAKTINLMKLLLMEYCVLSTGPSESLEDDITENCEKTGFNENTRCTNNGSAVLQASATGEPTILDDEAIASIATSLGTSRLNHHNYPEIQIPTESATERQIYRTGTENTTTLIKISSMHW